MNSTMNTWLQSCLISFSTDFALRFQVNNSNLITSTIFQTYILGNVYFSYHDNRELTQVVYGHFLYDLIQGLIFFEDEERTKTLNFYYLIACFYLEKNKSLSMAHSTLLSLVSYIIKNS